MKMLPISKASRELTQALAEAKGETVMLTHRGHPVAEVRAVPQKLPYPKGSPERAKALQEMMQTMEKGFDLGLKGRRFTRDEMHER